MAEITIPTEFYNDHVERGLPAPPVLSRRGHHYVVDRDHPDMEELLDDAAFYTDPFGPDACPRGLKQAAHWLLKAVQNG